MLLPVEIRIVIPCYNEPEIRQTVQSLWACSQPACRTEVVVVVNSYLISPETVRQFNRQTYDELNAFARKYNVPGLYLTPLLVEDLPGRQTGAGLPRKTGMDRAANQFESENYPQGIIISLDADCTVAENYLTEIYRCFRQYRLKSATIEFHHPVEHLPATDNIRKAAEAYEGYLRYYRAALAYTGYPYAFYTIGSAFAVTAQTYRQAGGMGKQQAGEDFYFLQKVFPLGKTQFIDSTCVYPSARTSSRVPFGTGTNIAQMLKNMDFKKLTYRIEAFTDLKNLFNQVNTFFRQPEPVVEQQLSDLPLYTRKFLEEEHFIDKISEINRYTTTPENFRKRFFYYFTAFKILKYLNFVHPNPYPLADAKEQWEKLHYLT
ncbi:MAG: hypothetical protein LBS46_08035 [Dysgonamonadaceae bacterium]|jgi:hypothetical protein|nr:hypothetical protein [Dysgonamonadaceae bacterium]